MKIRNIILYLNNIFWLIIPVLFYFLISNIDNSRRVYTIIFISILSLCFFIFYKLIFKKSNAFTKFAFFSFTLAVIVSIYFSAIQFAFSGISFKLNIDTIDNSVFFEAYIYMLLYVIFFLMGLSFKNRKNEIVLKDDEIVRKNYYLFSIIILVFEVFVMMMDLVFNVNSYENSKKLGYITRMIPSDLFLILAICIFIFSKEKRVRKILSFYFIILLIHYVFIGVRGGLLFSTLLFYFIYSIFKGEKKISFKFVLIFIFVALALPIFLGASSFFKGMVNEKMVSTSISKNDIAPFLNIEVVIYWILRRFQGYTATIYTFSDINEEMSEVLNLKQVFLSTYSSILPDRLVNYDNSISIGLIASHYYNGLSWDVRNAGSMFIFSITFILFKWWGIIFAFAQGFIINRMIKTIKSNSLFLTAYIAYCIYVISFSFVVSGNIDGIIARLITDSIAYWLIVVIFSRRKV